MKKKPFKPFRVVTIKDLGGNLFAGSGIRVDKVLKCSYRGVWSSMFGSYTVTVKKKDCVRDKI